MVIAMRTPIIWISLGVLIGTTPLRATSQETATPVPNFDQNLETPPLTPEITPNPTLDHSPDFSLNPENSPSDSMAQVTNVSQLRDVQPSDWAYEAMRSLVERYGCLAGYPDGTFRGDRSLTRFEFAAGLNACLEQINRIIAIPTTNFVTQ